MPKENIDNHEIDSNRSLADFLILSLKGFCMGIADIIPGVSGGTIAFMTGIYEDLIKAIKSFDFPFIKLLLTGKISQAMKSVAWRFMGAIFFGIACSVLIFSKIISTLLTQYPIFVNAFFFGLIVMTIFIVLQSLHSIKLTNILITFISALASYFLVQMVPVSTPDSMWFIFLCGAIAICAMILPGISGAFILLLLGKYQFIVDAVHERNIQIILILMLGMTVGLVSFVRILEWFFKRFNDITLSVLAGFVAGSLNKIWPWKYVVETMMDGSGRTIPLKEANYLPNLQDATIIPSIGLAVLGIAIAFALHAIPQKHLKG